MSQDTGAGKIKKDRKIVHKIDEGIDPRTVYCTTYQMRNFYQQFADGWIHANEVMNYIQHYKAVLLMRKGDRVLDVCCGRGLLLPMIRWYRRDISEYVGIDISENNLEEQKRRSGIKLIEDYKTYYPFKISHVLGSVEDMGDFFVPNFFDFIVYTSAIEHMQKDVGLKSLRHCYNLIKPGGTFFLSCPNTMNKKDPYDTQYAAHVYEWDLDELSTTLKDIGFFIKDVFGLVAKVAEFESFMKTRSKIEQDLYKRFSEYIPSQWLMSFFPVAYPEAASEVLILATKGMGMSKMSRSKNGKALQLPRKTKMKGFNI